MSENEEIVEYPDPEPGKLAEWVEKELTELGVQARNSLVLPQEKSAFEARFIRLFDAYSNAEMYDPDIVFDAHAAKIRRKGHWDLIAYFEKTLSEDKKQYLKEAERQYDHISQTAQLIAKYTLIAYGASFLFVFSALLSEKLPEGYREPMETAAYFLVAGVIVALAYILLDFKMVKTGAVYYQSLAFSYDRSKVKVPPILKIIWIVDPLSVLSMLMIPLTIILFINQVTFSEIGMYFSETFNAIRFDNHK
ncbi:MAG: hypothetical protein V7727_02150 [Sneathiella sp.]